LELTKKQSLSEFLWSYVGGTPVASHCKRIEDVPLTTPLSDKISKDLKKLGFKFVGSTIITSFLQACGFINDHLIDCFVYKELTKNGR
jgi:DNA-3-methyladenine glycosylase I